MLVASLALALAAVPETVVFEDGQIHIVTPADVGPDDDVIVRGHPTFGVTIIRPQAGVVVQSITTESGGWVQGSGQTTVLGDLEIQGDGDANLLDGEVRGLTRVLPGGRLNSALVHGDVIVAGASEVSLQGVIQGSANIRDVNAGARLFGRFEGDVTIAGSGLALATNSEFLGPVTVADQMTLRTNEATFDGTLLLRDSATLDLQRASSINTVTRLEDSASVTMSAVEANVSFGQVTGPAGVIIGLNSLANPFSFGFSRTPGTSIQVNQAPWFFGETFCSQSLFNSTGRHASMSASGSPRASDNNLRLGATDLPMNSFMYFFVGDAQTSVDLTAGRLCVSGNIGRYLAPGQIQNSMSTGSVSLQAPIQPIPGNPPTFAAPGQTYFFQGWYRDANGMGLPTWRFTEGLSVTFI